MTNRVIYDFGSNNGDDLTYYLKKAETVVAVEANPHLCAEIRRRFDREVCNGHLQVENCVLVDTQVDGHVAFYIHKTNHVLSQFPPPRPEDVGEFERVILPSLSAVDLVKKYGDPQYVKIDIERSDAAILRSLFMNGIRPPYISAESHSIEVFALLVGLGGYNAFKLVDGQSVSKRFKNHLIGVGDLWERHSFPAHSAGPYGDDIDGEWMSADNFFTLLALEGLGWKDIHATTQVSPNRFARPSVNAYMVRKVLRRLGRLFVRH